MKCSPALLVALLLALAVPATAAGQDELPPSQDNGAENSCGNPCTPSDDPPPREACKDVRSPAGSVVRRRLPKGPVLADGQLGFRSGVCVYLPPGADSANLRYPVLYLLHGGGGDQGDWISQGEVQGVFDAAYRADPRSALIVVTPDGTSDASWFDRLEGGPRNEEYVLRHLIGFVDRNYRTLADRRGRAIAGLSNGGHGALYLASAAPDLFEAVGAMSANVGWQSFTGGAELNRNDSPAWFNGHLPLHLAGNLDGLDLVMDIGTSCMSDATKDACGTYAFEQVFLEDNRAFVAELEDTKHVGVHDYRETEGGHSWRWWPKWLGERELPFLLQRLSDPQPAGAPVAASPPRLPFRYRSVQTAFSVYGYDIEVVRKAREVLDLSGVTEDGLTVRGSGRASIRTAALYTPRARYLVAGEGEGERLVTAGPDGRLRLGVDLGKPHEDEQFTEAQQEAEKRGTYWTVRRVRIEAAGVPATADGRATGIGACARDRRSPVIAVDRVVLGRRTVTARGRAGDRGCAGVRTVLVAVARRSGTRCRFLTSAGDFGRARRCGDRRWLRASGTEAWRLRLRARLPRGAYRVTARSLDAAGNASRTRTLRKARRR